MSQALGAVRCMLSQNVRKQIQTTEPKAGQPVSHNTTIFAFRVHKAKVRGLHVKTQVSQTESFLHWVVRGEKKWTTTRDFYTLKKMRGGGSISSNMAQMSSSTQLVHRLPFECTQDKMKTIKCNREESLRFYLPQTDNRKISQLIK